MKIAFCRCLIIVGAMLATHTEAVPLQSRWVNTNQVLSSPGGMKFDNFPTAISVIPGQFIASDVWVNVTKMSDDDRKKLKLSGKLSDIDELDLTGNIGNLYHFTMDNSGKFHGTLETSQLWHLFGSALGFTKASELVSTPDQDRVYRYKASEDGFLSDHWFSEPRLLHPGALFGSAIANNDNWLAIAAENQGWLNDGEVFIYPWEGSEWGNSAQSLKPDHTERHFGHQLQMQNNQLLVTTRPYKGGSTALGDSIWKQDIYVYNLTENLWKKSGNTLQLTIPPTGQRASATLINGRIAASSYDYAKGVNTVVLYVLSNNQWKGIDTEEAPNGSKDFGYTLQAADSELLVSQHSPQTVLVFNVDDLGIHDSGQVINHPDPDKRPGFADLMAFDGKYLFIARRGTVENKNDADNYPGKIFVFTREGAGLNETLPDFTYRKNETSHH